MSSFPEDVYLEILVRLPVKSIYTYKCVCKSWFHIISCPSFIKIHLNHAKLKNNLILMYTEYVQRIQGWRVSVIGHDSLSFLKELFGFDDAVKIELPFEVNPTPSLQGHCNGLIYFRGGRDRKHFCLWNPATKEYKIIPKSPTKYIRYGIDMRGFGYDCKTDDYKVIHIGKPNQHEDRCLVNIYSLGSNSWKSSYTELDYNNKLCFPDGVLANGALHWLCTKNGKDFELIISFDISDERFREMQPPKEVSENKEFLTTMGALEGLLCVLVRFDEVQFSVWVMQHYGLQDSWTKRYVITHPSDVFLMCSLDKGKILFSCGDDSLVLYDGKHEYGRKISMDPDKGSWILNSVNYFESLVSVNSGIYVGGNQEEEDNDDSDSDSDSD